MLKRLGLLTLTLLLTTLVAFSQTGTIKGFVYDRSSGEPMIYTTVVLKGTRYGVQTDLNGYFSITQVPAGEYTLFTSQIGYDSSSVKVVVNADDIVTQKLFLGQKGIQLQDVEVSATKNEQTTQVKAGSMTVTPREMKLLPSTGGEPDIAQFLQVTPGVVFTGDQGGQLYIRGGSPSQTGILLDGVTIYNPFHSIGLYSVFETDAIRSADIHTAGFGAEFGNRTSAILDIRTKDGNKNRLSGKLSASPIMARGMLEGPISRPKEEGGSSTTFLLSVKHSYLESTSKSIYSGLGEPFESGLPYTFTDLYGKVTFNGDNGSKLNVFGFNFDDKAKILNPVTDQAAADFNWKARGAGATFLITPGSSKALISGKFAYSKYDIDYNEVNFRPRQSAINGFEGALDFTYFLPGYSQLKYGVEVSGFQTTLDYVNSSQIPTTLDRRNTLGSVYASYRKNINQKFIIEPSIRLQYYATISKFSPEPRLGMKYNISKNVRLKAAAGLYSQNIISTKSDRDVVNFFTGFLLSPDQTITDENGNKVDANILTAYHALGGIEVDVQNVSFNLEPWVKNFTQTIELNRNKQSNEEPDYQAGNGRAYGVDLSARYSKRRIYFWGTVSYQNVENTYLVKKTNGTSEKITYPTPFDRRFNMNLLGAYTAGRKKNWEISARYSLGSPFPFTQTQGFYENLNMFSNGISTNYTQQNGNLGLLLSNDINGGRLSWYHRLDFSVKKRFYLSRFSNLETTFAVTNVYDRNNIFYVDRISAQRVYQLPVFPSLNATWNF